MTRVFLPHVITDDSALGGSEIERSLRFIKADSAYLSRTPSAQGDRRVFTLSWWMKLGKAGVTTPTTTIFSAQRSTLNPDFQINLYEHALIIMGNKDGNSSSYMMSLVTEQLFRDPSAWYHCVVAFNTSDGTSSNRIKIYVNGSQVTNFAAGSTGLSHNTYPSSGDQTSWGTNEATQNIGRRYDGDKYFDGYLAEINYVDGSQLTADSFGFTDDQTGIWMPKRYEGTYGTNGFYLDVSDNSSAAALGIDKSPNGNDFTTNNFSVSAGAGNDSLEDTPTNNFCTLNSVNQDSNTTLSEGSLKAAGSSSTAYSFHTQGTFVKSSGKWYYEVEYTANGGGTNSDLPAIGWARTTIRPTDNPTVSGGLCYRPARGDYVDLAGNNPTSKPTTSLGNVVQVAIDFDAGKIWFGNGGTFFESGNPSTGANANITFTGGAELLSPFVRSLSSTFNFNFGQRPFSYTVPVSYTQSPSPRDS